MYSIELIDCATPSFISAVKKYYGTQEDIMRVLETNRKDREDMYNAAVEYFSGKGKGIVRVYHGAPTPFIRPVKVIGETSISKSEFRWKHKNVWDCFYHMRADNMECKVCYIETIDHQLVRCIRPTFVNLRDHDKFRDMYIADITLWGHPGIVVSDKTDDAHKITTSNLMVADKIFKNLDQVEKDIQSPNKLNFSRFFDDVFGDG